MNSGAEKVYLSDFLQGDNHGASFIVAIVLHKASMPFQNLCRCLWLGFRCSGAWKDQIVLPRHQGAGEQVGWLFMSSKTKS